MTKIPNARHLAKRILAFYTKYRDWMLFQVPARKGR